MGRKGKWFSSVKKAFSPESNKKKSQKSKNKTIKDEESAVHDSSLTVPHPLPPEEELKLSEIENEESGNAYSEAVAIDAEVEAVSEPDTEEVIINTAVNRFGGKSEEEVAAIKIQTAFRGYQARRSLRALRGLVRLKSLVQGPPIKRQTATALRCMQTLARVQTQIQSRRIRMSEENQALQRQLLQKRAKELASLKVGEEWDDSSQSKEQVEANLLCKYEAAMRRERAMAYSFTHQQTWKKSARPTTLMFMDPNNPQWGWSWLERWTEARPWDTKTTSEKELSNDHSSLKSGTLSPAGGEITKAYAHHLLNSDKPSTPRPKAIPLARKLKLASPKESVLSPNDDPKNPLSLKSEKSRRHSIAGSLARDDESLASSPSVPSYMAQTHSAKAKVRGQSPLGMENGTPEKDAVGSTKKRLSYPASPARPRRHSGPPKVEVGSVPNQNVMNGIMNGDTV